MKSLNGSKVIIHFFLLLLVGVTTLSASAHARNLIFSESPSEDGNYSFWFDSTQVQEYFGGGYHDENYTYEQFYSPLLRGNLEREIVEGSGYGVNEPVQMQDKRPGYYYYDIEYVGDGPQDSLAWNEWGCYYGDDWCESYISFNGSIRVLVPPNGFENDEINLKRYNIYYGDFNQDGVDGDIYFLEKDTFIFVGVDVLAPIRLKGDKGFVYYRYKADNRAGVEGYEYPVGLQLAQEDLSNAVLAQEGADFYVGTLDGWGEDDDLFIRGQAKGYVALNLLSKETGLPSSYVPVIDIDDRFDPSDRSIQIQLLDHDGNGRDELVYVSSNNVVLDVIYSEEDGVLNEKVQSFITQSDDILAVGSFLPSAAGELAGQLRINESGAASYSIPVNLPAGTAGVTPSISMSYSSQAGNGLMGKGWSLNAFVGISRCAKTLNIDREISTITWTSSDEFCLAGQRLLLQSGVHGQDGAVYQTAMHSGSRVTLHGNSNGEPDYFTQIKKDGSVTYFGYTQGMGVGTHAKQSFAVGKTLVWAQSVTMDNMGNPVVYNYQQNSGRNFRLTSIKYAYGSSLTSENTRVEFTYEERPDYANGFWAGFATEQKFRLKKLNIFNSVVAEQSSHSDVNIRTYNIFYSRDVDNPLIAKRSLITSIQECVRGECKAATKFDWNLVTGVQPHRGSRNKITLGSREHFANTYKSIDINGDGLLDLVWAKSVNDSDFWDTDRNSELYFAINNNGVLSRSDFSNGDSFIHYRDYYIDVEVLDYNADGKQDVAVYGEKNGKKRWYIYLSVSNDGGKTWQLSSNRIATENYNRDTVFVDVNGDGLTDMLAGEQVYYLKPQYASPTAAQYASNQFYAFQEPQSLPWLNVPNRWDYKQGQINLKKVLGVGDFNGDGRVDIIASNYFYYSSLKYPLDVGSGSSLSVRVYPRAVWDQVFVLFQTDNGFEHKKTLGHRFDTPDGPEHRDSDHHFPHTMVVPTDINGDGLTDVVYKDAFQGINIDNKRNSSKSQPTNSNVHFFLSNGLGFEDKQTVTVNKDYEKENPALVDYNRDGYLDLLFKRVSRSKLGGVYLWDRSVQSYNTSPSAKIGIVSWEDENENHAYVDVNGDGLSDAITFSDSEIRYSMAEHNGLAFEAIVGITSGVGAKTELTYEPINNTKHYKSLEPGSVNEVNCVQTENQKYDQECAGYPTLTLADFYTKINKGIDSQSPVKIKTDSPTLAYNAAYYVATYVKKHTPVNLLTTDINNPSGHTGSAVLPTTAISSMSYHYCQARVQAGGQGFLGFKGLTSIDHQTDIKTSTTYRQDYPFIGSPSGTQTRLPNGDVIAESHNIYDVLDLPANASQVATSQGTKALGPLKIYPQTVYDMQYATSSTRAGGDIVLAKGTGDEPSIISCVAGQECPVFTDALTVSRIASQTVTQMEMDSELNTINHTTTTKESGLTQVVHNSSVYPVSEVVSVHGQNFTYAQLGRLTESTVSQARNGLSEPVKKARFEYYNSGDKNGLLKREIQFPDGSLDEKLITTYDYDVFGNVNAKSVSGWDGKATLTRTIGSLHDNTGRYVVVSTDALGNNYSQIKKRNEYGSPTRIEGVNGVVVETLYDKWGVETQSASNTGSWSRQHYKMCHRAPQSPMSCPAGAVTATYSEDSSAGLGVYNNIMFYDNLGRELRKASLGFNGDYIQVDTEYDIQSRPVRVSNPYFASEGGPSLWTRNYYNLTSEPLLVVEPNGAVSELQYSSFTTTTLNSAFYSKTEVTNSLGELVQVIDDNGTVVNFEYTTNGELRSTTVNDGSGDAYSFGSIEGLCQQPTSNLQTIICFDGLGRKIKMWDPDKGLWSYEYNAFGELIKQTNANNHTVNTLYDKIGRTISRVDTRSDGSIEGTTTWYYDTEDDLGQSVANARLKQTAVVYTEGGTTVFGDGTNYAVRTLYDEYGRAISTTTTMPDGNDYESRVNFDAKGRIDKEYNVMSDTLKRSGEVVSMGVQHHYNSYGQLYRTTNLENGQELYRAIAIDARGQLKEAKLGNLVTIQSAYKATTGEIETRRADITGLNNVQYLQYEWDNLRNLKSRHNTSKAHGHSTSLKESFCYDNLNRLVKSKRHTLTPNCAANDVGDENVSYNALGNITYKTGVGSYTYGLQGANGLRAGPHAVTSAGGLSLAYDASGNVLYDGERTFEYSTFDKPVKITKGAHTTKFKYGPSRSRFYREDAAANGEIEKIWYLGNIEKVIKPNGAIEWRRMLTGGGFYTYHTDSNGNETQPVDKRYILKDHLGSTDVILSEGIGGNMVEQTFSFDSWGQRRQAANMDTFSSIQLISFDDSITNKGFTGHEMLDEVGIIHMNGRIYDPRLGRFLQADPNIDGITSTQGFNRYSYVHNNPLNATDPTGFFLDKLFGAIFQAIAKTEIGGALIKLVGCATGSPWLCAAAAFAVTAAQGGNFSQSLKAGAIAGASEAVGGQFGGYTLSGFVGTSLAGGAFAKLSGGNFSRGFFTAGINKAVSFGLKKAGLSDNTIVSALVGGTTSKISGGKFVNGAATGAFAAAVSAIGQAQYRKDMQEFYDSLGLDSSGDSGTAKGWTSKEIKKILKMTKVGRRFLKQMRKDPIKLVRFTEATDTYTNPDGTTEVVVLSNRLKGNYHDGTVRLNARLPTGHAVFTLYHEYQHHLGFGEVDARVLTEQFAIDMGVGETAPGFRAANGTPNRGFIESQLRPGTVLGEHYKPSIPRPRLRQYGGEEVVKF